MLLRKHDIYNVAVRLRGHAIQLPKQSERDDLLLAADILMSIKDLVGVAWPIAIPRGKSNGTSTRSL